MTFYDKAGDAIAYTEDGENLYLFSGEPVAYLLGDLLYDFHGNHLGRFSNGWIRDNSGYCVLFTDYATGGLIMPIKHITPVKAIKRITPLKSIRRIPFIKPVDRLAWSSKSGRDFFFQI